MTGAVNRNSILFFMAQATLEKLLDMRETLSRVLVQERNREKDTCTEATQLVRTRVGHLLPASWNLYVISLALPMKLRLQQEFQAHAI